MQYEYGLRQGRSRKLADRPASFTSAQGKTISVEQQTAVKNEKTLQRGRVSSREVFTVDMTSNTTSTVYTQAIREGNPTRGGDHRSGD